MIVRRCAPVAILITLAMLTACGGGSAASAPAANSAKAPTADEVTTTLIGKIPTVKLVKAYTAADDPNHLLGRPNGYTSKTAFADNRVPADQVEGSAADDTTRGGSVEVYADAAGAKTRMDYIQAIGKASPLFSEYDYVNGGVLVRVSHLLTPDQATNYEAATKSLAS
ncbi:MAG: putative secreted protein [Amycolatopsis sp.]|uniref:hypothetical protein n=1 Tax=Amycolatopsis sp. TaxID=37632 RepID=UPI002625D079|nr:hypothetical protein [Amycolatopsis sp.]MCU1681949.1 putative secreted protein [Amycolatopsis sp.]